MEPIENNDTGDQVEPQAEDREPRNYVIYTKDLGLVISQATCPPQSIEALATQMNCYYMEGMAVPGKDMVVDGVVVPRPVMPITVTGLTLAGVPFPSDMRVGDSWYPVTENTVELDLLPGTYQIAIYKEPYLIWEYTLENPTQA